MVYLAAVLDKKKGDASSRIQKMLRNTGGPENTTIGVASKDQIEYLLSSEPIKNKGPTLLAVKNTGKQYPPLPLVQGHALAFEGFMYQSGEPDDLFVANKLEKDPEVGITVMIKEKIGAFSVIAVEKDGITCGRDVIGTIPLYFGESDSYAAVASNKKMIWCLNLNPEPVMPGTITTFTKRSKKVIKVTEISPPRIHGDSVSNTIKTLDKMLSDIAKIISRKIPEGAVSFSGGIDSTLIAYYLKKAGVKLHLICIGIGKQKEYIDAVKAAEALDLPLTIEPKTLIELEEALPDIVRIVEDPNFMKIGVATPLYFSAKVAKTLGHLEIFSGNGSDEVFGGYMKYLRTHLAGEDPKPEMVADVKKSWDNNFDRDTKICRDSGLTLHLPFSHPRIIEYGLSIPLEYLLPNSSDEPRKIILRKLANFLGVPDDISKRPKRAAQYSTGVSKAIFKLSKRRGLTPWVYLNKIYKGMKEKSTGKN